MPSEGGRVTHDVDAGAADDEVDETEAGTDDDFVTGGVEDSP
jgi:hypothetical protein